MVILVLPFQPSVRESPPKGTILIFLTEGIPKG